MVNATKETQMTLTDLLPRLENGTANALHILDAFTPYEGRLAVAAYNFDANAAMDFARVAAPGWKWALHAGGAQQKQKPKDEKSRATTLYHFGDPARALLIATVKAMILDGKP